jgi:signal transduction histidine kinase
VRARGFGWQRLLPGLVVGATGVAAVTGVVWALQPVVPVSALAGLYVLAVLPVAVLWGVWPALIVSVVSAVAFDFFFFPPRFALTPTDPHIEAIVVISAVTSVVVSALAGRVRRRAGEAESLAREVRRIAEEQSALRRVATLVAGGAAPAEVFGSVAAEVGGLFGADVAVVFRFEPERTATVVGRWSVPGMAFPDGARLRVEGVGVTVTVLETGRPARTGRFEGPAGSISGCFAQLGARMGTGAPISVEGRLWGAVVAAATEPRRLPAGTEERLAGFTELVATAIANAQARVELRGFAEEQAALRRVATLVARAASPEEVFAAVTAEVRRVLAVDLTVMCRYDPDTVLTYVGWSQNGNEGPVGVRVPLGGRNVAGLVFETGRPARIDDYGDASGPAADVVRPIGLRAAVGVPVSVEGRLWGVMTVASMREQPPPAGTEDRLAGFTELVATAIANAQARAALTASRARIVAAADTTRRRIERDLHDGTQQRLVALGLTLRLAQSTVPAQLPELQTQIGRVAHELDGVIEELREISRGIHPAVLSEGGLGPALRTLARRAAIPVKLEIRSETRPPDPIEVAAYYVVSEALTNTTKHAHASLTHVTVEQRDTLLHLSIRDDGIGGADPAGGSGLIGLRDRVQALGGSIEVKSPPGEGTAIVVELQLQPD